MTTPFHSYRRAFAAASVLGLIGVCALIARSAVPERAPSEATEMFAANEQLLEAWGEAPAGALSRAIAQKQAMIASNLAASVPNAEGEWHEFGIGPLISDDPRYGSVNGLGIGNLSGRIDSFDYDPVNKRLFASIGTGGIWMSADLGQHWRSIGDNLPSLIVGQVAWTPAGGGTVLAGGGEPLNAGFTFVGMGAYWSNDLGATWNHATGVPDGVMTYQIEIDPSQTQIVYMGTSKGLYRSTDAGRSYVYVALPTGCSDLSNKACLLANFVTDVVVKEPGGLASKAVTCGATGCPVLAVVGFYGSKRKYVDGTPQAPGNGLYRSDSGAPGTWTELTAAYGTGATPVGFATKERLGRTHFGNATGSAQDHNYVYAIVQDAVLLNGGVGAVDIPDPGLASPRANNTYFNGLYVSSDFGSTWIRMADETEIANPSTGSSLTTYSAVAAGYAPGIQAWYNLYVAVDPTRSDPAGSGVPTRIVFGLEEVWTNRAPNVPLNGTGQQGDNDFKVIGTYFSGTTCQFLGGVPVCPTTDPPTTATTTHPDQHAALFIPDAQGGVDLFVGNDGGVYTQHAVATTGEFDNSRWGKGTNAGFYALLPYSVAAAKDCTVWFGLQDNGSGRIEPSTRKILETYGGDGTFAAVDATNSRVAYTSTPGNALRRTTDGGASWTSIKPTLTGAAFVNPFVLDPTDAKHLMTGAKEIMETLDAPTGATWTKVFDIGTAPAPSNAARSLTAVDLYSDAAYVAFCGTCSVRSRTNADQQFARGLATNVGGAAAPKRGTADGWHFATAAGLPNRYITSIKIDPTSPSTVYVTLGGYSNAQWQPPGMYTDQNPNIGVGHVFRSADAGESFADVSGNLPDLPIFWVTLRAGQLIAGTQIGPFISNDVNGTLWAPMGTGMPNVPIMQFNTWLGDLTNVYAATYGRGVWRYVYPGQRDICPVPAPDIIAAAPVQGAPTNVESPTTPVGCGTDTNGAFKINFTYTLPSGGTAPSGFRIEEATRVDQVFFDNADETLSGGSNSKWQGTSGWISQVNPNTQSLAYYVPDTMDQNETLTLKQAVTIPPGGAQLSFQTTQATEECCDFTLVDVSTDGGTTFATAGSFSGNYIGQRQLDLSPYAGNPVKLRFRLTSDSLEGSAGWYVEDIRILSDDFVPLVDTTPAVTSQPVSNRPNGKRYYRVRGLFSMPAGTVAGPYSNNQCVTINVPNTPPIARAGTDFTINEGQGTMLNGAGSSDPDGGPLGYSWTQTAGPSVTLSNGNTASPSFTAPAVNGDAPLTFRLTVTDNQAATAFDDVIVTVHDLNLPPVANAGGDFSVTPGQSAMLSGAGTTDPDGDALTYAWTQIAGPNVALNGADTATASFTAPQVAVATPLTFRLTVTDPSAAQSSDDIVVTVTPPQPPIIGNTAVGAFAPLALVLLGLAGLRRARRRNLRA